LREIGGGLASCEGKRRHLGLSQSPKRSTLAYANEHRPWQLYQRVFEQLLSRCQSVVAGRGGRRKFRFKNKLMSLDSTVVDLALSLFDWAHFRRTKGAIKLHLLLDHDGYLPHFAVITTGKTSDITVARSLDFDPGTILVLDRAYIDYDWFVNLSRKGVYFVTRLKAGAAFEVVEQRQAPERNHVLGDRVIFFYSQAQPSREHFFRLVEVFDHDQKRKLVFLTNDLRLAARTIADIYWDCWQVELFFKALEQSLKIKSFLGTSVNAVKTQIGTVLIAMLLVRHLQLPSFDWSLSNLVTLLRHQLFAYCDLYAWLDVRFHPRPLLGDRQLELGFTR